MPLPIPIDVYKVRLAARGAAHDRWARLDARLSYARLAVVALAAALAWLAFGARTLVPAWIVVPAAGFIGLMVWHDRVIRSRDATARAVALYARGIARIEDRWTGGGDPGLRFLDENHLYAQDLDLFGRGSLFELLSIARTRSGEDILAGWLKAPSPLPDLRLRQQAVEELRDRLDFREVLASAGAAVGGIDTATLTSWAIAPPMLTAVWPRIVAPLLAASVIGAAIWWGAGGSATPLLITALAEMLFARMFRARVLQVVHGVERSAGDLDAVAQALIQLEKEPVATPRLTTLRTTLTEGGASASAAISRLQRLSELHDWQHNQIFAPIAAVLLWSTQLAWAIEGWRREFGARVPVWLSTLGDYEALSSLAAYAYEHPSDPFPALIEDGPGIFDGTGLGHPLVPAAQMVPNDVRLAGDVRLLVVSGSNMSGKSTLLRTVGINAVLALAGAPVRAQQLELTPLSIGATLRIQDSLQAGRSRFFAEISKICQVADLAKGPLPLLFLFDELLQGTNSHDRAVGAAALLRTFLGRGTIGLITTHDLALTSIVEELNGRAANVHFEDRFDRGELAFDYRMRPGPVTRSNALELMRAVGLEVDGDS